MSSFKSSLVAIAAAAALLMAMPAFAQTSGPTATTAPGTTTTTAKPDFTCGKIVELSPDHVVLATDANGNVRITLDGKTRFVALSFGAAQGGLNIGTYARAAGGDGQGTAARSLVFGNSDFCGKTKNHYVRVKGTISAFAQNYLTVDTSDANKDSYTFRLTQATKFYVNGKQVQVPDFKLGEAVAVLGTVNEGTHAGTIDDPDYTAVVVRLHTSK